jgi:alpha-galactosidase
VTAPATAPPLSAATLSAAASYGSVAGTQNDASSLGVSLASPVASPYLTANTTGTPSSFGESGGAFAIDAAGAGIAPASSRGPAVDQYGAIYLPGGADSSAVAQTTVTTDANTGRNAKAGLLVRNDETASASSPEGVALYFTGSAVGMSWAAAGGPVVDTTSAQITGISAPVQLRLVRAGTSYAGYYSLDGSTWVPVATATLPAAASNPTQDVGIFTTSASAGAPGEADFGSFTVTG